MRGCAFRVTSPQVELLLFLCSAAAAPAGFCLCALFRMRASDAGDTAFLFSDEIEHDRGSDTEQNYYQNNISHKLLAESVFRLQLLVGIVDDCDDRTCHSKNRDQTCDCRTDVQCAAGNDGTDGVNEVSYGVAGCD